MKDRSIQMLRKIATTSMVIGSALLPVTVVLGAEFVPADLVRSFTGGDVGPVFPPSFPRVKLPVGHGLSIVGTLDRANTKDVLVQSSKSADDALEVLRTAYSSQGWTDLTRVSTTVRLCNNEQGVLTLRKNTVDGATNRVQGSWTIPNPESAPVLDCAQQALLLGLGVGDPQRFFNASLMPVLELPPSASGIPDVSSIGLISLVNGRQIELINDGVSEVPATTVASLYEFFALQMLDQGWAVDSESAGERSAISVWYRTVLTPEAGETAAQELPITGTLTILGASNARYRVTFRLTSDEDLVLNQPPLPKPEAE